MMWGRRAEGPPEFAAEFDRLFERAYTVARRLIGDPSTAEDVAAEALTRTYVHWNRVRGFDYRDALGRTGRDEPRNQGVPPPPGGPRESVTADPSDATTLRLALVDTLARIPRREREAVALRFLADLTIDDVRTRPEVSAQGSMLSNPCITHLERCAANLVPISHRSARKPNVNNGESNWRDHRDELFEHASCDGDGRASAEPAASALLSVLLAVVLALRGRPVLPDRGAAPGCTSRTTSDHGTTLPARGLVCSSSATR